MISNKGTNMQSEMDLCRDMIEIRLNELLTETNSRYATLIESMRYSLLSGGKRARAVLCMKFCEATGGELEDALDAACAIEMLHAYTLIHDDLPSMDGDDTRRGKPSNHIAYGEFTAILAGDALQAAAFESLSKSDLPTDSIVKMVQVLAQIAGPHGVCGGQYLDLSGEGTQHTIDELKELYSLKTSALISAATRLGVIAGGGTQEQVDASDAYAQAIGLAFQVRDDILDCTATAEELGKPIGSDVDNEKSTFASLLGVEASEQIVNRETETAINAIKDKFENIEFLIWIANALAERKN
ncbi:MAG: polyprenyl synthetase family protein [Oscillospiraceae bacterium]|nr:polyprenyl synthetase family protein [Oscillospiraceae bacterium]